MWLRAIISIDCLRRMWLERLDPKIFVSEWSNHGMVGVLSKNRLAKLDSFPFGFHVLVGFGEGRRCILHDFGGASWLAGFRLERSELHIQH